MRVPFKYLGLEVGGNSRKNQFWESILNKISARLSAWKGNILVVDGKNMPSQIGVYNLTSFYLSFFKAPESVCKRITSIQRSFLRLGEG